MKKITKLLLVTAIAVLSAVACFSLSACGSGDAKVKGVYLSPAEMSFANMRPKYDYYITTFTHQELTVYEDGTYCLIVSSSTFSALVIPDSGQDAKGNERDNSIVKYYGTYTSAVNELDDDLLDITLKKPTRIISKSDDKHHIDTAAWTEEMGKLTKVPSGYDPSDGSPIYDENTPNQTAEGYLELNAFDDINLQANVKKDQIDFIKKLGPGFVPPEYLPNN